MQLKGSLQMEKSWSSLRGFSPSIVSIKSKFWKIFCPNVCAIVPLSVNILCCQLANLCQSWSKIDDPCDQCKSDGKNPWKGPRGSWAQMMPDPKATAETAHAPRFANFSFSQNVHCIVSFKNALLLKDYFIVSSQLKTALCCTILVSRDKIICVMFCQYLILCFNKMTCMYILFHSVQLTISVLLRSCFFMLITFQQSQLNWIFWRV